MTYDEWLREIHETQDRKDRENLRGTDRTEVD